MGFCLSPYDRLSNPAQNLLSSSEESWWSEKVRTECFGSNGLGGVCGKQAFRIKREIRKILADMRCGRFSPEHTSSYPVTGNFARAYLKRPGCSEETLMQILRDSAEVFPRMFEARKERLSSRLYFHERTAEYPEVHHRIVSEIQERKIELDPPDVEIWLDAHDAVLTRAIFDLIFVSDNTRHVTRAADIICCYTNISRVQELEMFRTEE